MRPQAKAASTNSSGEAAAERLFAPDGPLAYFHGPAVAVGPGGHILAGNERAGPLIAAIRSASCEALDAAIAAALAGEPARLNPVTLDSGARMPARPAIHDIAVMPFAEANGVLVLASDVTLERTLHHALVDSRQRYKDLAETSSDFVWEVGPDGCFTFVSPDGALGYRPDALVGKAPGAFTVIAEGDDPDYPFNASEPLAAAETWFRRADGEAACLSVDCRPLFDQMGTWRGARGLARDVTETRALASDLARARHRERLLAYVLHAIRNEAEPEKTLAVAVETAAPALAANGVRVLRHGPDGVEAVAGAEAPGGDAAILEAVGSAGTADLTVAGHALLAIPTRHRGQANGVLAVWRNGADAGWSEDDRFLMGELAVQLGAVLQQLADREALRTLSDSDGLTGLLNRRAFEAAVTQRLASAARAGRSGVLLYVDLDNFKLVNDRLGHAAGDEALKTVAAILRRSVRLGDLVARLGGDEFALWLDDFGQSDAESKVAELARQAEELKPLSADARRPLGFSIGVTRSDPRGSEIKTLLQAADAGMYGVKRARKEAAAKGAAR